uniref:Uncharacterized protein n=1 Tax=Avena sativa TaxID=4498 RepID=A0ACD5VMH5_AVESA
MTRVANEQPTLPLCQGSTYETLPVHRAHHVTKNQPKDIQQLDCGPTNKGIRPSNQIMKRRKTKKPLIPNHRPPCSPPTMSPRSETFRASLRLPPGVLPSAYHRRSGLPGWVLLDSQAYMVNVRNETTAGNTTHDGLHVQVSFLIADPPRLSYCCICCTNREENPFACVPRIVTSVSDLALIQVDFTSGVRQWLVYGAQGDTPSLHLLPDLRRYFQKKLMIGPGEAYGIISHDQGRHFVLAALSYIDGWQYTLHIFRSSDSTWNQKLLQVDYGLTTKKAKRGFNPTYVVALGGGLLGWVDLWEGILVCDVLALAANGHPDAQTSTAPRFIPMPRPLPSNQDLYLQHDFPRKIRDVTFDHGQIRCVELEQLVRLRPKAAPVVHDPSDMLLLYDSESPMVPDQDEEDNEYEVLGWRLVNWYRELTWDHWRRGSMVHSDDLGPVSLPQLGGGGGACAVNFSFNSLQTWYPTLRGGGDDVIYSCRPCWISATKLHGLSLLTPRLSHCLLSLCHFLQIDPFCWIQPTFHVRSQNTLMLN